jgi:hypothetical protein
MLKDVGHMKKDPDLDALRQRDDSKQLLLQQLKAEPKASGTKAGSD